MKNYLMSTAVGDIAGSAYEGRSHRTKDYQAVKLFSSRARFTDDTVLTFACAEAFLDGKDMAWNLWKCAHEHIDAGYGSQFKRWLAAHDMQPYRSFGNGADKATVRERILAAYYPEWAGKSYTDIHDSYTFNTTCPGTVGPAILAFLESSDYADCIRLAIALGGDADTLAAIAGPMAYACYREMPDSLVYAALKKLPDWMVDVNERFDEAVNR